MAAACVDGEYLADLGWVLTERIGRRHEEHPAAGDEPAGDAGVGAPEVRQLQEVRAVAQEQLGHPGGGTTERPSAGPVVIADHDDLLPRPRDAKPRHDAAARSQRRRWDLLVAAAIRLDSITSHGVRRDRSAVESDRPTVEKDWVPDAWVPILRDRHVRLLRELFALAGAQVEEEDLRRLVPGRVGAEVDERHAAAVRTDREGPPVEVVVSPEGIARKEESRMAAGGSEAPESTPVGADVEDALPAGRLRCEGWNQRELLRHLDDHPGPIWQHRDTLEDASKGEGHRAEA